MNFKRNNIEIDISKGGLVIRCMNEKVIRLDILQFYYDLYKKNPSAIEPYKHFLKKYNITEPELIGHVLYLHDKRLLMCICSKCAHDFRTPYQCYITAHGIDAIENPEQFASEVPFLKLITIYGDVTNSQIMQAENIRIENGFNRVYQEIENSNLNTESKKELLKDIEELESEGRRDKPDIEKIKSILDKVKKIWSPVYDLLKPLIQECIMGYFKHGS